MNRSLIFRHFVLALALALSACQSADTLSSVSADVVRRMPIESPLKPFKDDRFAYRPALEDTDRGNFVRVPYDEQRDINARDEVPVRKVREGYINRLPKSAEHDFTYEADGRTLNVLGVGRIDGGAVMTVIYLHGRDGTRQWGFDDERFGGNFNRAKNLMVENGSAWLSPDFTDFDDRGAVDIAALIARQSAKGAGQIILACGSLGTKICWALANKAETRKQLSGLIVLGGFPDREFIRVAYSSGLPPLPVYLAHGSNDPVYPLEDMIDFYKALVIKDYPVRMSVFETGNHGTPVRMVDWRQALNWIVSR
jgi:predicted esterase